MRLFSRTFGPVLVLAIGVIGISSLVWADVEPDQANMDSNKTKADPQQSPSKPLGQFAQPETAPIPTSIVPAGAPMMVPANATAPVMPTNMPATDSSAPFPKVQTKEDELMAKKFSWWPTDAKPAPFKDPVRSGYWWWPDLPGEARPWGNQGWVYVRKIIFDYKSAEGNMKPSLVIKRIIKNVKVYFDYDKANVRDDAAEILDKAMFTLDHNQKASILITGNADIRGSEKYNEKLGERRAAAVETYLTGKGLSQERIRILSRGKLDALAPTHDLVGMQKDRNAQFVIAEVEEVMIPADKAALFQDKNVEEKQELVSEVRVSTKDYVIKSGDTLWGIAEREYGDGKQWKRIYEFNKDKIANPNRPKKGTKILIPIE